MDFYDKKESSKSENTNSNAFSQSALRMHSTDLVKDKFLNGNGEVYSDAHRRASL